MKKNDKPKNVRVAVLSDDAVFARMLEIELGWRSFEIREARDADLLVVDADAAAKNAAILPSRRLPAIYFGRGEDGEAPYLRRPFEMSELFSLIDSILSPPDAACGVALLENNTVSVSGELVALSDAEYALLALLIENRGRTLSRGALCAAVFPDAEKDSNVVDVYVHYLRKKLGSSADSIRTVRGAGYALD